MTIPLPSSAWGLKFIAAAIADGSTNYGPCYHLFTHSPAEGAVFVEFDSYVKKYGKTPSKEVFEHETGQTLPDVADSFQYFKDKLWERHVHRSLVWAGEKAVELLGKKQPLDAFNAMCDMLRVVEMEAIAPKLSDFREAQASVMKSIASKLSGDDGSLELGWPTLDNMGAGLRGGDLVSIVGRPGQGKSFISLYAAYHVWMKLKQPVLFVSMEMPRIEIEERLAVIHAKMPYDWVNTGGFPTLHTDYKAMFSAALEELKDEASSLHIVDAGMTAMVDDIVASCATLKPAAVFVDGAYLLKVSGRFSKYEKIGEVCRELKQLAARCNVPVIASWQFNRGSTKAKNVGLEHVAGSDEIGQLSSVVLGLSGEETINNAKTRTIDIIKGRSGQSGRFYTHFDFQKMDFSEAEVDYEFEVI